jgi:hypothetical protein
VVERWQIRKWECPVVLRWFPVDVSCVAFICYSVGACVCACMCVGDCVCGEEFVVVVELCRRRRRKMSSVCVFGCDIHCHSFSIHTCQSLL